MTETVAALAASLTVVAGASLTYLYARSLAKRDNLQSRRAEAYADFIRGAAGTSASDSEDASRSASLVASARARIGIYGSKEAAEALASFFRSGGIIAPPDGIKAFILVIKAMRRENVSKNDVVSDKDLAQLLVGTDEGLD